ncbi:MULTISPECIES: PAS domain S-box protein [Cyanophyceae]|uniref:PAS domain S-box protein n=1 Tax=Cyanophyceae TaxID=3028117 RepID=UPI001689265D|nr:MULTISPECIES: PAS domain S-box protein [Cyanophyceae]MBD1916979.1 PAS domain S-box protein [Phormidium sp. FACHB-77]MBD2029830.1 PAS domain S-box protein [Phormidium sp. FACHB-322]MBD2050382.1 PAS domain S-box protein [Leptolyngbya sp. FACHB-60]
MSSAPLPNDEAGRLEALRRYEILDTPPEAGFDRITALAARLFNVPMVLISLVDESRAWFKSCYGFEGQEMQRHSTFCSHALLADDVLVVPEARYDSRFADNPLVQAELGLRFYAGAPLRNQDGFILGTLCLLDNQPRDTFGPDQQAMLSDLAAMVIDELDLRLAAHRVAALDKALLAVTQGVATQTGDAFFSALVLHLTQTLGVDYTYIGLVKGDGQEAIQTIAACAQGQLVENFEYLLHHTPCDQVLLKRELCCYAGGIRVQFPQAALLHTLSIDSYAAIPFFDPQGNPLGLLGVMDSKPWGNVQLVKALLPIFALRVATELDRQRTDAVRLQVQQDLKHLVAQRTTELSQTNHQLQLEIAERQQADIALEKEQELLRVLLENVQAGIVACDEAGMLSLFNQTARDFHGLPESSLPPDQWADYYDLYHPDGKTPLAKEAIPLFRALQGERVVDAEMVIAPKGGQARTVLASGQAIATLDGSSKGAVVVMHDITERKQMENALRDSEARLFSIFETIPNGLVILDPQGQLVSANSAAKKILRLTCSDLTGRAYNDPAWLITAIDGQPFKEEDLPFAQVMRTGAAVHGVEHAIAHDDGTRSILCINASPLFDAEGRIANVVTSISDITSQKQAEATLQASEERYRSVIETVAEGIVLQHVDGSIFTCNASAEEILGLTAEQMMGRSSLDPRWATIYENGSPFAGDQHPAMITLRTGEPQSNVVMGVHKPDGTLTWISINTRPLFHPDAPTPFAVVASFSNITAHKTAEAERAQLIREQAARLDAEAGQFRSALLVDISTALASLLNHTETLERVADRVVPFFADWCAIDLLHPPQGPTQGIERVAMAHCDRAKVELGWQLHRQYPPSLDALEGVPKILRTGQTQLVADIPPVMLEAAAHDAEHLRLLQGLGLKSCIIAPLIARGQTLGAVSFVMAETGRRYTTNDLALAENIAHQVAIAVDNARLYQAEQTARSEAEAANRIKDEFLAVLSHELRSPLNPILGWSQLLQKRQPDATTLTRGLQTIERNAKLQTQLIADLLDMSRILQGKLSLEVAPVQLQTTVEAAMETVRLAAEAKAIEMRAQFDPAVAPVMGDAGRLQQVVWNLLANAVKFTPEGGRIEIQLRAITPPAHRAGLPAANHLTQAELTVTDTGKGIAPEVLPHVFERFRQADSKTTRQFGGLGLGLAIARQLVELHGGTITAASPGDDQGATFTVRLPLQRHPRHGLNDSSDLVADPSNSLESGTLAGISILVVEDEIDAREMLVFVLEQAGAAVTATASAEEALKRLPDLAIDILISDIAMPQMDGYMLMQQMRAELNRRGQYCKAIALTAYASDLDRRQALAAGFHRHLSKPFEPAQLIEAIATLAAE